MHSGVKAIGLSLLLIIVGCSSSDGGPPTGSGGAGGTGGNTAGGGNAAGGLNTGIPPACMAFCAGSDCDSSCPTTCQALESNPNCKATADTYFNCATPIATAQNICWSGALPGEACQKEYYALETCQ
jgi:hypothetical protein